MSWGDDPYAAIPSEIKETDHLSIEPAPLNRKAVIRDLRDTLNLKGLKVSPLCRHCFDPYLDIDENPDYPGLCIGCAEYFRDLDAQDDLVIAHETAPSRTTGQMERHDHVL